MKKNCKRRQGINRIGCMWVFISIFGSNHRTLKMFTRTKTFAGNNNEMKQLTCSCESSQESVQKLIDDNDINVSIAGDEHVETKASAEEKFREIIKRLIAQKEGEIQTCKDLLEAFHVLDPEDESLLKKSSHEDPQSLGHSQRVIEEEEEPKAVVLRKRRCNFFSKKWRSEERRNRSSQVAEKNVVLKPTSNNKSKTGRTFSRFLIGLIKRRLQSSVPNKSCNVHVDKNQTSCVQEKVPSKSRKHVSDEEEPVCNEETSETDKEDTVQTYEDSKKIMPGLYIAARKHLSEMLANGDIDVNLQDKEVPRILGKILSLPEFSSPGGDSPRLIPAHDDLVSHLCPLSMVGLDYTPDLNRAYENVGSALPLNQTTEKPKFLQCGSCTDGLTDEDSDKDDETLCTIDVSVPRGEKTEIDPLAETCSSSISRQVEYFDEDVLECREEDGDKTSLSKEMMFNQTHPLPSLEPPPSYSVKMTECKETATDVQGKLSPVSVLEPLFTDDESSSTTKTRFSSAEMRIQPLCIRFDEADSPKPDKPNNLKTSLDDKELTLAYIEAVVKSSGLSLEELLTRPFYFEELLEPELTDDIVFYSTQLCDDKNLLNDCINEVLMDFCGNELNPGPWISFLRPEHQLISDMEVAAKVAQEGVYWHLIPLPSPHTLDQIVKKDMAKTGSWMDLRFDIGWIGSGTSEMILDDLVEEIIRSYREMVQAEPTQDPDGNNPLF